MTIVDQSLFFLGVFVVPALVQNYLPSLLHKPHRTSTAENQGPRIDAPAYFFDHPDQCKAPHLHLLAPLIAATVAFFHFHSYSEARGLKILFSALLGFGWTLAELLRYPGLWLDILYPRRHAMITRPPSPGPIPRIATQVLEGIHATASGAVIFYAALAGLAGSILLWPTVPDPTMAVLASIAILSALWLVELPSLVLEQIHLARRSQQKRLKVKPIKDFRTGTFD